MLPTQINQFLQRDVIGQEESLRFVAVAIFKHLKDEPFGNLMLIGSSGTGKTTIMRAVERIYEEHDELAEVPRGRDHHEREHLRTDEGVVDTRPAVHPNLEERARRILGDDARTRKRSVATWSTPPSASTRSTRSRVWSAASRT